MKRLGQLQKYVLSFILTHVPLLKHGFGKQAPISFVFLIKIKIFLLRCIVCKDRLSKKIDCQFSYLFLQNHISRPIFSPIGHIQGVWDSF